MQVRGVRVFNVALASINKKNTNDVMNIDFYLFELNLTFKKLNHSSKTVFTSQKKA